MVADLQHWRSTMAAATSRRFGDYVVERITSYELRRNRVEILNVLEYVQNDAGGGDPPRG